MITVQQWLSNFVNVTEEELAAINDITETTTLKANEIVLKQGQVSSRIGLLVQGATRTFYTDTAGNERTIYFAFEGQPLIVVDSFLHQLPSSVSSATLEPCVIVWTDYERFTSFMQKFPKYNTVLLSGIAKWFAENKGRLEYQSQLTAKAKYDMLCKLEPHIIERVPLKYIASYLGITQETLSRIRAAK